MNNLKKCFYLIVMFCFLTISLSFHLWAEGDSTSADSGRKKDKEKQEQAPAQNQPRISFDSTKYDAGEVWEGDEISHDFIIKNTGTAELNVSKVKPG